MASVFEQTVDAVHVALAQPSVQKGVFRRALEQNLGKRCVVWIPVGGRIEPATTGGVRGLCFEVSTTERVQPLSAKTTNVRAVVMAESFETLEKLHDQLLVAVHAGLHNAATPGAFTYASEADENYGHILAGRSALVQEFAFDFVVIKKRQTLITVTEQTHECDLDPDL